MNTVCGKIYESISNKFSRKVESFDIATIFQGERSGNDATENSQKWINPQKKLSSHLSNPFHEKTKSMHAKIQLCNMYVIPLCTHVVEHYYHTILFYCFKEL